MQGDCMDLMKDKPDNYYDLSIVDPPFNIGKANWDKIDNYVDWIINFLKELQRVMKDNSSVYLFHNDFVQLSEIQAKINKETNYILRQFIVWNKRFDNSPLKGFLDGYVEMEGLRNYQKFAEYICFYTFQDSTGLSKIMGNCVYPIRDYIRKEIIRAKGKIVLREINQVLGTAVNGGGVASACISEDKTVPAMITEEHYLKIRKWLNNGKDYEYLRKDYEDLRYTFNNQKTHHSVWNYDIAKKQTEHITEKPVALYKNILRHSAKEGCKIIDPFGGSGSICIACWDLKFDLDWIELDADYYKEAVERFKRHKNQLQMF